MNSECAHFPFHLVFRLRTSRTTFIHMTCAPNWLKLIIAATEGFKQDVDGYYSRPPRMISLGKSLAGSQEEIAHVFRILVAAGIEMQRSVVLPLDGAFVGPAHEDDGNVERAKTETMLHSRWLWSILDLEPLLNDKSPVDLLEANYPAHATKHLRHNATALADLHAVIELDLRPVRSFDDMLEKLDQPYYRCVASLSLWHASAHTITGTHNTCG